jgi:CRP-like cAMP-binding protein
MSIKDIFPIDKWDFKSQSILSDLPEHDLDLLLTNKTEKLYKKGETVFWERSYPDGIFYISEGKVKMYKVDNTGREQIIYVANKGELIGYHAVLAESRYPDSATALEESLISFIPKKDFLFTLQQSETLNRRLLKTLSHEFEVLANSLSLFTQKSVRERLALQLIVLREKYKTDFQPGMPVEINMSREDLANLVGTGKENIVRILSEFKEDKILETKGRLVIIHDVNKLIKIADYR